VTAVSEIANATFGQSTPTKFEVLSVFEFHIADSIGVPLTQK